MLAAAKVGGARSLVIAIPNAFEATAVVDHAKQLNPAIRITARAHSDADVEVLRRHGAVHVIMGEREIARGMLEIEATADTAPPTDAPPAVFTPAEAASSASEVEPAQQENEGHRPD